MFLTMMMTLLIGFNYQYTEDNITKFQQYNTAIILLNKDKPAKWARWCIQEADMEIVYRAEIINFYVVKWIGEKPDRVSVKSSLEKLWNCNAVDLVVPDNGRITVE